MDFVPSMSAISVAAQKLQYGEATAIVAVGKEMQPAVPEALDPRSVYALSAQAADALLSLVQPKSPSAPPVDLNTMFGRSPRPDGTVMTTALAATPVVSPETTKVTNAANRNWSEDVRLEHSPYRKVGVDTVVQYDNPRVMAAWSAAFPDISEKKFRGLSLSATNFKAALSKIAADGGFDGLEKNIYLLCSSDRFRSFSEDHPDVHINWIDIDNNDILLFWPKDAPEDEASKL